MINLLSNFVDLTVTRKWFSRLDAMYIRVLMLGSINFYFIILRISKVLDFAFLSHTEFRNFALGLPAKRSLS